MVESLPDQRQRKAGSDVLRPDWYMEDTRKNQRSYELLVRACSNCMERSETESRVFASRAVRRSGAELGLGDFDGVRGHKQVEEFLGIQES
jgi:hypothetical protein